MDYSNMTLFGTLETIKSFKNIISVSIQDRRLILYLIFSLFNSLCPYIFMKVTWCIWWGEIYLALIWDTLFYVMIPKALNLLNLFVFSCYCLFLCFNAFGYYYPCSCCVLIMILKFTNPIHFIIIWGSFQGGRGQWAL